MFSLRLATLALWVALAGLAQNPPVEQRGVAVPRAAAGSSGNAGYYALVIGINRYQQLLPLAAAVADAEAVAALLREQYGFQVQLLLDGNATRAKILDAINLDRRSLGADDSLLVYYAGHGHFDRDADRAYWLPADATSDSTSNWISADDLTAGARTLPARHVLFVADSCYSGGLTRDANVRLGATDHDNYLQKMRMARSRNVMASGGNEPVADSGASGHSVFANVFLNGLLQMPGSFTAAELFERFVRVQVAGATAQVPQYDFLRNSGHEDGDFVFPPRLRPAPSPTASTPSAAAPPPRADDAKRRAEANLSQLFDAGLSAIQGQRWDDAIESLTQASRIDPSQASVWSALGSAYNSAAGPANDVSHRALFDKGLAALEKALQLKPEDSATRNNYAIALTKVGRTNDAAAQLEKAAALDSSNSGRYYFNLGAILVNAGDSNRAAEAFRKATVAEPPMTDAFFQYASTQVAHASLAGGKAVLPTEALDNFTKYLLLSPNGAYASLARQALAFHGSPIATSFDAPESAAAAVASHASGGRSAPVSVGGTVQAASLISPLKPTFPPLAKSFRIQGTVRLQAIIAEDGAIQNLTVGSGHPMLVGAAIDAVKTWRYRPTLINRQPVQVRTQIDVVFNLGQ